MIFEKLAAIINSIHEEGDTMYYRYCPSCGKKQHSADPMNLEECDMCGADMSKAAITPPGGKQEIEARKEAEDEPKT